MVQLEVELANRKESEKALRVVLAKTVRRRLQLAADDFPDTGREVALRMGVQPDLPDTIRGESGPKGGGGEVFERRTITAGKPHYVDSFEAEVVQLDDDFPVTLAARNTSPVAHIIEDGRKAFVINKKMSFPTGAANKQTGGVVARSDIGFSARGQIKVPALPGRGILREAIRIALSRASR